MKRKMAISEIEFDEYPNEKYKLFFAKFSEIDSIEIKQWKPVHLLGYFCKKYESQYGTKYKFKFNAPNPTNCFEVFNIKKLSMNLTKNPEILKSYIDWVFESKVKNSKRKLTSISFLNSEDSLTFYKLNVLLPQNSESISRSVEMPSNYQVIFSNVAPIKTYGDLAFIYQSYQSGSLDLSMSGKFSDALSQAISGGFDTSIFSRIV